MADASISGLPVSRVTDGCQLIAAAEQDLGGLGDDATAFPERRRRPCPAGGRDLRGDGLDRFGRRHRDAAQGLASRRVRRDEVGRFAVERCLARWGSS